jgi:hypothetical protein
MRTRHIINVIRNIAYLVTFEEGKPLRMLIFRFQNGKYFYIANPQNYVQHFLGGLWREHVMLVDSWFVSAATIPDLCVPNLRE